MRRRRHGQRVRDLVGLEHGNKANVVYVDRSACVDDPNRNPKTPHTVRGLVKGPNRDRFG